MAKEKSAAPAAEETKTPAVVVPLSEAAAPVTTEFKPLSEVNLKEVVTEFGKTPAVVKTEKELEIEDDKIDKAKAEPAKKAVDKKDDKPADKKPTKGETKKPVEEVKPVDELTIEDEKNPDGSPKEVVAELELKDDDVPNEEMESSFVLLGKEFGMEVKADTFEDFKAAVETKFKEVETISYKKGQTEKVEDTISTLDPEAQFVVNALNAGVSLEEIRNPGADLDKYLAMDNENLIIQNYVADGWTEAKAKEQHAVLVEEGKEELAAYAIRQGIQNHKKTLLQQTIQQKETYKQTLLNKVKETEKKENKIIVDAINKVEAYEGIPISKTAKEKIIAKWNSGYYKKEFKDNADFVTQAILDREFKKVALTKKVSDAKKLGAEEKTDEFRSKLHNTDQLQVNGATGKSKEDANQKQGLELMVDMFRSEQAKQGK